MTSILTMGLRQVGVALVEGRTGTPASVPAPTPMEADGPTPAATADASAAAAAAGAGGDAAAAGGGGDGGDTKTESVRPLAFKTLVGRGHPEFSSVRQQVRSSQHDCRLVISAFLAATALRVIDAA